MASGGLCCDVPPAMAFPASKSCLTADVTDQHSLTVLSALLTCCANFTETFTQCSKSRFLSFAATFLRRPFKVLWSAAGAGPAGTWQQQQLYTVPVIPAYTVPLSFSVSQSARKKNYGQFQYR